MSGGEAPALVGSWSVTEYACDATMNAPVPGTRLTAVFGDDGRLVGSTGCNTYRTRYTTDGENIRIEPPAATRKYCAEPEGVMAQEAAFHQGIAAVERFALAGDSLELFHTDGTIAFALTRSG